MLTSELFQVKNIKSKFARNLNGVIYHFGDNGILYDENGIAAITLRIHEEWELIPQEVPWSEAIAAWLEGEEIEVDPGDCRAMKVVIGIDRELFKKGKWYIK